MPTAKVAVTIDEQLLSEVDQLVARGEYPSRSRIINEALAAWHRQRDRRERLLGELAKLNPEEERALADERLNAEVEWPAF